MIIQDEKIELQENVHRRTCVRDITYLAARSASNIICRFFRLLSPFRLLRFYSKIFLLQLVN